MNILFMIGNGFDLAAGLETRISDFLSIYLEIKNDDKRIRKFKDNIKKDIETWADFEKQLGIYTDEYTMLNRSDFDFCARDFTKELITYLRHEETSLNYENNKEKIKNIFSKSILKFKDFLTNNSKNRIEKIFNATRQEIHTYNFITFNYTKTFDECLNIFKKNTSIQHNGLPNNVFDIVGDVLHIHGTLTEGAILGVDNESQIKNEELRKIPTFTEQLSKPLSNEKLGNGNNDLAANHIKNSKIIIIFGMSIGETDSVWWKRIGEWLFYEGHHLIIFNVDDNHDKALARDSIFVINRTRNLFLKRSEIPEEKWKEVENKIHIGINTKIFDVKLIN